MSGLTFPRTHRLLRRAQYTACYDDGRRYYSRHFVLFARENSETCGHWRLGLAVSKKLGNAVRRNRIKRLLREFFRLHQARLAAPLDIVVVPKRHVDAKRLSLDLIGEEIPALLAKAERVPQEAGP